MQKGEHDVTPLCVWSSSLGVTVRETLNFYHTLQNFIYKHIADLKNVQKNKKKEKGEFTRHQVNTN